MMIAQKTSQLITNRYELMDEIGAGGMGVVYRARDHLSQSDIALKSIAVNPLNLTFNSRTSDRRLNLALAREFTTLARLRHPNIVSVLDFGFEKQPFFTMPLVSGAHKITDFSHELDWQTKKHLVLQMLYALQYLHRHQILHRA